MIPIPTPDNAYCYRKDMSVSGIQKQIDIDNVTLIFHICDQTKCKHRRNCVYMFPESFYICHICSKTFTGEPVYRLKPKSRICGGCGETLTEEIPPNARALIFERM